MNSSTMSFDFDKARFNMIEQQIRTWEVLDSNVLGLLGQVHRENFVPEAYRKLAFADIEIPLTHPAVEGECMLAPKVEARTLQDLALQPHETVLEIGTGSGYMAALLSRQCSRVVTFEINPRLAQQARINLQNSGIGNVEVREADATANRFAACATLAPFDAIVLSGSVSEVPAELLEMLRPGGRLCGIVGQDPVMRMNIVRRTGAGAFHTEQPWETQAPRLLHFPESSGFAF